MQSLQNKPTCAIYAPPRMKGKRQLDAEIAPVLRRLEELKVAWKKGTDL